MPKQRQKLSGGPNESPIDETIAGTGRGIPDEALGPGKKLPEPPTDEQIERERGAIAGEEQQHAPAFEEDELPVEGQ